MPLTCQYGGAWSSDAVAVRTCALVQQTCGVNPAIARQPTCGFCSGADGNTKNNTVFFLINRMLYTAILSRQVAGALTPDAALALVITRLGAAAATQFLQDAAANCSLDPADAAALAANHGLTLGTTTQG